MKPLRLILLFSLFAFSCQKELEFENIVASLPTLTTVPVTSITSTTATGGGNISNDGGAAVTARGVCWSTSPNPVVSGNHTTDGTGSGVFSSNMTGLTATTIYYVRAYATNSAGTAYGNEISFTTTNTSTALPTVTTNSISAITMTTASGGGNVVADGGATVTARGVCWSTTVNPVATGNHTTDGTGTGSFTSAITGLTAATTYHVRAYATNSVGTSYGGDSVFTTASTSTIPTIITTAISSITGTTANSGGTISTDGGAAVTVRGVCWSTTANPTIALSTKTTDGTGIGTFTSAIAGLTAATTYHVRAYATNSVGTAYGNDLSFTTTGSSTGDVYVSGFESNGTKYVAKIWKNGVATDLTDGTKDAEALSVFISGTDVYVAGQEEDGGINPGGGLNNSAKLWKNGVVTSLTNGANDAIAKGVFVSGSDVYVVGHEGNGTNKVAKIWKNGVVTSLTNGLNQADAITVFVSGSDVYVAGYEHNGTKDVAKIWKNGIATSLTNGVNHARVFSVTVSGTDVYAVGYEDNGGISEAKMWKNGTSTVLTNAGSSGQASWINVSGGDVYVAGYETLNTPGAKLVAKIWKNGTATSLTNGTNHAVAYTNFIFNSDVYVAGFERVGGIDVAKIWKNGVATSLSNGTNDAKAYSIFVK